MTLPHDENIQIDLMRLLSNAPDGRMHCRDVYRILAKNYPYINHDELTVPYHSSLSHWANRVQFARLHLVKKGWVLTPAAGGGRGYWAISRKGHNRLDELENLGKKLLAKFNKSGK